MKSATLSIVVRFSQKGILSIIVKYMVTSLMLVPQKWYPRHLLKCSTLRKASSNRPMTIHILEHNIVFWPVRSCQISNSQQYRRLTFKDEETKSYIKSEKLTQQNKISLSLNNQNIFKTSTIFKTNLWSWFSSYFADKCYI